jgi:hypothetical protein
MLNGSPTDNDATLVKLTDGPYVMVAGSIDVVQRGCAVLIHRAFVVAIVIDDLILTAERPVAKLFNFILDAAIAALGDFPLEVEDKITVFSVGENISSSTLVHV